MNLYSISYGNGTFVAISGGYNLVSTDRRDLDLEFHSPGTFGCITFGNGHFLKIGWVTSLDSGRHSYP